MEKHCCVKRIISLVAIIICVWSEAANLLQEGGLTWRLAVAEGATGTLQHKAQQYLIEKTNQDGYVAFVGNPDRAIVPGRHYLVSMTYVPEQDEVTGTLMIQMPGGSRTPFPSVSPTENQAGKPVELVYLFTAREDETKVRPHLIVRRQGRLTVTAAELRELSEAEKTAEEEARKIRAMEFDEASLTRIWGNRGRLSCGTLGWKAADIQSLEVSLKVDGEGGYLRCNFTSTDGKQTFTGYQGQSLIPDGEWHTLMFPVGRSPAWRDTVTQVEFTFSGQPCPRKFRQLICRPYINGLYDIRPRAEYVLSRLQGNEPVGIELLDADYRVIQQVMLPPSQTEHAFTADARTMVVRTVPAAAPVLLTIKHLEPLDKPAMTWRGSWIWSQNGFGPNDANVWLMKEFTLEAKPTSAMFIGTGDDSLELYINGQKTDVASRDWHAPGRGDVTAYLRPGVNRLVAKVHNVEAWGGFLGELAMTVNGQPQIIATDGSWRCAVGGEALPTEFPREVFVLGEPPVAPWGARAAYRYVGPVGRIRVMDATGNGKAFIEVLEAPQVATDRLTGVLRDAAYGERPVTLRVTPPTGAWRKGEKLTIQFVRSAGAYAGELFLNEDFIETEGQTSLGYQQATVKTGHHDCATARVVNSGERLKLRINGKDESPFYNLLSGGFGSAPEEKSYMVGNFARAGMKIMRAAVSFDTIWKGDGQYDFSIIDRIYDTIRLNYPGDVRVILQIGCGMPQWWVKANPADAVTYYGGAPRHRSKDRQELSSKKWLTDAEVPLRAILNYLRKTTSYGQHTIGIAISEGWNSEWFWPYEDDHDKPAMAGYSPSSLATFRTYLREKYATDKALATAWNMPGMTLSAAPMPSPEHIRSSSAGCLLSPQKDMQIHDYFMFRSRSIGDAILHFCRVVKEETGGDWLAGCYYGYFLAFSNIWGRLQTVGHLDIERVARSPYVDFVTAPSFYTWRHAGEGDATMQLAESFTAHGKMVVVEQDLRTFTDTSDYEITNGKITTPEQTIGAIERAYALSMTRGVSTHWLDMYDCWLKEPMIIEALRRGTEAYDALPPVRGTTPVDICLIADTESAMYCKHNSGDGLAVASVGELRRRLNEMGAPFHFALLRDVLEPGVLPKHKLYIACNLVALTPADRTALQARFAAEGATVLWLYAAGVTTPDGEGPSAAQMASFLGLEIRCDERMEQPSMDWSLNGVNGHAVNFNRTSPWFIATGGYDEVLGRAADGRPLLVSWKRDSTRQVFSTLMNLPPRLLRELARQSGVHIYSESDDILYAGNDIVALHAKRSGLKTLKLPSSGRLRPVLGTIKEPLTVAADQSASFQAQAGRTYVFLLER